MLCFECVYLIEKKLVYLIEKKKYLVLVEVTCSDKYILKSFRDLIEKHYNTLSLSPACVRISVKIINFQDNGEFPLTLGCKHVSCV